MWRPSVRKGGASWRSVPGASLWPPVENNSISSTLQPLTLTWFNKFLKFLHQSKMDSGHVAKPPPYLHPLGQKLGIFRGLLLVLLSALSLQSNAATLVLQHTRSYQSLDPGSFSSGFLACRKTIAHEQKPVLNGENNSGR